MPVQTLRGNPEIKQVYLTMGFQGGMNVTFADDLVPPQMMRNLVNYDLESIGELAARKGFGKNSALTTALYPDGYNNVLVDLTTQKEVFFTLLQNDNSAWQLLSDCSSYQTYIQLYGENNKIRYLRLLVNTDGSLYWEDETITLASSPVYQINDGTITSAVFTSGNQLLNWQYTDKYGRLYFTNNDKGLFIFDAEATDPANPWTTAGDFGVNNIAYKPNGIEVRKLGFNVIGNSPLSWVYESELTTESIQGMYITTTDRKPLQILPAGQPFQINILYTGDTYEFTIGMLEYDTLIELTATKNVALSTNGTLAVYDVVLKTQPSGEVEISIDFVDPDTPLDTYYDYYTVGAVPGDAEIVEQLNVGEFKIVEMYDRLVYYKGNAIWFSEVDVYDYIPNFNYVLVPLDKTDEIVSIKFFRTSYIVFTKRRIYKLEGDFEQSTFNLTLVNDNIGCVAGNTPMVINNEMLFVSTMGLRSLKTDTFRENLENIKEFDESIYPMIKGTKDMFAIAYKDQYVILSNLRGVESTIDINFRSFKLPDVIRFYYKQGAFVSDIYAKSAYPEFMFMENGEMYSFRKDGIYKLGDSYDDFGKSYEAILETTAVNFGYPTHEKKVKNVILKAGGGSYEYPITLQVASDGEVVVSSDLMPTSVDNNGNIIYEDKDLMIPDAYPIESMFGDGFTNYHTKKFRASARGKNIAIRIVSKVSDKFTVQGIGFIYKLGKVRE